MKIFKSILPLRKHISQLKHKGKSIGFVPTMGALHDGHLSLLKYASRENDIVVLSIFINPTQFGMNEDLSKYPREEKNDILLAKKLNVDIIFYPSEKIMYPPGYLTYVTVNDLDKKLCGKKRPNHFKGVTTVVCKLLNIVTPDTLYLGQKDAQQAVILSQLCRDLNYNVRIKICPIVRDKDGLALSSRNNYLNDSNRKIAPLIYQSLQIARDKISKGEKNANKIERTIIKEFKKQPRIKVEYIECVDFNTLDKLTTLKNKSLIAVAVKIGKTRLIDNICINIK